MNPLEYITKTIGAINLYKRLMGKGNAYAEADAKEVKALHDLGYEMAQLIEKQDLSIKALMLERQMLMHELFLQDVDKETGQIRELHKMFKHSKDPIIQQSLKGIIECHVELLKVTHKQPGGTNYHEHN